LDVNTELAKMVGRHYKILEALYPDKVRRLSELAEVLDVDVGNLSKYIKKLEKGGIIGWTVEEGARRISLTDRGRHIASSFVEPERPEWTPSPEEVRLCIEALKKGTFEELKDASGKELKKILESGYWDGQIEAFLSEILEKHEPKLVELETLYCLPDLKQAQAQAFFKRKKKRLLEMVVWEPPENPFLYTHSHNLLAAYLNVEEKAIDGIREFLKSLDEKKAERMAKAIRNNSRDLYKKYGVNAKKLLYELLEHPDKEIREMAHDALGSLP
jgi:DNA-binding MarR family transcriptional regulator